jgi:hypothetical protein
VYDGLNPVQELSASKAVIANMLTGLNTDEFFTRTEPGCCGPLSYLTDALGSTQSLADSSPIFQRFISQDPIEFSGGTTNLYQYGLDAPTVWLDPFGLDVTVTEYHGVTGNSLGHLAIQVNNDTPVGLEDSQFKLQLGCCDIPYCARRGKAY